MVKEHRSHVVQMAVQGEEAASGLVRPNFNFIIVTPGHEQRLGAVEINAPDRSVVFLESVYQGSHTVIP